MKTVKVVATVIYDSKVNKIFATARGYGEFKGQWEFPGGKIEEGESKEEALKREMREELDISIGINNLIDTINYTYPTFHLIMDCYLCEIISGNLILKEAESAKWLSKDELDSVNWLPADLLILDKVKEILK